MAAPEAADGRKVQVTTSAIRTPPPSLIRSQTLSLALEVRFALLAERLDALIGVLGDEHAADRLALDGQADVERGPVALRDRELRVAQGHARAGGEPGGVLDRPLPARSRVGKEAIDQPRLLRLPRHHGPGA